jgi:hypothetical protein
MMDDHDVLKEPRLGKRGIVAPLAQKANPTEKGGELLAGSFFNYLQIISRKSILSTNLLYQWW